MTDIRTEQTPAAERPLVTFALFAYNQEKYIREAVEGALAQTYEPLEIILSDDCSTDRTFEIIQDLVNQYNGVHKIILNINKVNLGLGNHINKVVDISHGELIVVAAGDDISLPTRSEALVKCWVNSNHPLIVGSNFQRIDNHGANIDKFRIEDDLWSALCKCSHQSDLKKSTIRFVNGDLSGFYGATLAWNKELFTRFGSLFSNVWYEDKALVFRALISRKITYCDEVMVLYRQHHMSMTNKPASKTNRKPSEILIEEENFKLRAMKQIGHLEQHLTDLNTAFNNKIIDKVFFESIRDTVVNQIFINNAIYNWWATSIFKRVIVLLPIIKKSSHHESWTKIRILPLKIFIYICSLKRNINFLIK